MGEREITTGPELTLVVRRGRGRHARIEHAQADPALTLLEQPDSERSLFAGSFRLFALQCVVRQRMTPRPVEAVLLLEKLAKRDALLKLRCWSRERCDNARGSEDGILRGEAAFARVGEDVLPPSRLVLVRQRFELRKAGQSLRGAGKSATHVVLGGVEVEDLPSLPAAKDGPVSQ